MSPTEHDLKKAQITQVQAETIATLMKAAGDLNRTGRADVIKAVVANDLLQLIHDELDEPRPDVLIP